MAVLCACCGTEKDSVPSGRVLLCVECTPESELTTYCPSCGERLRIVPQDIHLLVQVLAQDAESTAELSRRLIPGSTIRTKCPKCVYKSEKNFYTIFSPLVVSNAMSEGA